METQESIQEMMDTVNQVFHLSPKSYLYGGVTANNHIVYQSRVKAIGQRGWSEWDVDLIYQDILRLIEARSLAQNQKYVDVFRAVFSGDARAKAGSTANQDLILTELINRALPLTEDNLSQVLGAIWDSLADSPQAAAESEQERLRARRIAEMVGDPPSHGFSVQIGPRRYAFSKDGRPHDPNRGMAQGFSLAAKGAWSPGEGMSFAEMSDTEVDALYQEWRTTNELRSMSTEQLRKLVKEGGHTDLWGNHQSVQLPSAEARDEGALINEKTGEEITTRKELLRYISDPSDPYAGRRLITHRSSGKVIAAKRQRFEEIIRGERG